MVIRDETIRSSHDTIRIDTKGGDMIIYNMIWAVTVKIQTFAIRIHILLFMITLMINTTFVTCIYMIVWYDSFMECN